MYSKRGSVIIILLLLIPFVLRLIGYEPYPAILLPEGASSLRKLDNQVKVTITEFQGLNKDSAWVRLEPQVLIAPIPPTYMRFIFFKNLPKTIDKKIKIMKKLHLPTDELTARYAPSERNKYLKSKLEANNFLSSEIKMVLCELSVENGKVVNKKIINEKFIKLN